MSKDIFDEIIAVKEDERAYGVQEAFKRNAPKLHAKLACYYKNYSYVTLALYQLLQTKGIIRIVDGQKYVVRTEFGEVRSSCFRIRARMIVPLFKEIGVLDENGNETTE